MPAIMLILGAPLASLAGDAIGIRTTFLLPQPCFAVASRSGLLRRRLCERSLPHGLHSALPAAQYRPVIPGPWSAAGGDEDERHRRARLDGQQVLKALEFKCDVLWSQLDALHYAYVAAGQHSAGRVPADGSASDGRRDRGARSRIPSEIGARRAAEIRRGARMLGGAGARTGADAGRDGAGSAAAPGRNEDGRCPGGRAGHGL